MLVSLHFVSCKISVTCSQRLLRVPALTDGASVFFRGSKRTCYEVPLCFVYMCSQCFTFVMVEMFLCDVVTLEERLQSLYTVLLVRHVSANVFRVLRRLCSARPEAAVASRPVSMRCFSSILIKCCFLKI
uniref:Uncharacterized protein n=1 Tax=Rhipicephalus zambeziensis TaxID=60191 RepID=A0A224YFW9_9ACAR